MMGNQKTVSNVYLKPMLKIDAEGIIIYKR